MSASKANRARKIEQLEDRRMMTTLLNDGVLEITGTDSADHIEVNEVQRSMWGRVGGQWRRMQWDQIEVRVEDANDNLRELRYFSPSAVDKIMVDGLDGNDTIINNTEIDSTLRGGRGQDRLIGGNANDSLYGGEDRDMLFGRGGNDGFYGGKDSDMLFLGTGAHRVLQAHGNDLVLGLSGNDAVIEFKNSGVGWNPYGIHQGGYWTETTVETVDAALERIHSETGSTTLLKTAEGNNLSFIYRGHMVVGQKSVAAYNDEGRISVFDRTFTIGNETGDDPDLVAQQTIIHEIGHNWEEPDENDTIEDFRRLSGWSYEAKTDTWDHLVDEENDFLDDHAASNPLEDFATTFAAHFMEDDFMSMTRQDATGRFVRPDVRGTAPLAAKDDYMQQFILTF